MALRFRKSKNFGPLRLNVSSKGIGWSVGVKGFRYTHSATGKNYTTTSIPGTGISYRSNISSSESSPIPAERDPVKFSDVKTTLLCILVGLIIGGAILFFLYFSKTLPGYTKDNLIPPPPGISAVSPGE